MLDLAPHDTARDPNDGPDAYDLVGTVAAPTGERWRLAYGPRRLGVVRHLMLLPETGSRPPRIATVFGSSNYFERHERHATSEQGQDPDALLAIARQHLVGHTGLGRALYLDADTQLRRAGEVARFEVLLTPRGMGFWRQLADGTVPRAEAAFRLPEVAQSFLAETPAAELLAWLLGLDESQSELAFARHFLTLSRTAQVGLLWRGDLDEVKRVLRLAFLAQAPAPAAWPADKRALVWRVELDRLTRRDLPTAWLRDPDGLVADASLNAILSLVLARLGFALLTENRRHACVGRLWYAHDLDLRFYFRVFNPNWSPEQLGFDPARGQLPETNPQVLAEAAAAWAAWLARSDPGPGPDPETAPAGEATDRDQGQDRG